MKCVMANHWGLGLVAGAGVLLAVLGGLTTAFWPAVFKNILSSELHLSESSTSYRMWRDTPVPMYIQFYFFNWTNPEELEDKSTKPLLEEVGPYRFNEFHEKVNITFHAENSTVSFKQVRRWVFDPEHSRGDLEDQITTLNIPPLTAAFVARDWSLFMQKPMSYVIDQMETRHVTKSVREFLFDGYEDPLVSLADTLPALAQVEIPFDRFGWFYERNNSDVYDGFFNMDTGADDISKVGTLRYWNHVNKTRYFPSHCGRVNGSAGELWPPGQNKTSISMFSPDLCRSLTFDFTDEVMVHELPGYRFTGGPEIVDNGTLDADNWCFCGEGGGECLPVGVVNASSCRYGAPAFVSYPHFYQADRFYLDQVHGMSPSKYKHQFYVTLEPTTGIPLDVAARFQINILLQPSRYINMYKRVPKIFFPVIWFEQRATMTPELAAAMRGLLALPTVATALGVAALLLGAVLLLSATALLLRARLERASTRSPEKRAAAPGDSGEEALLMKKKGIEMRVLDVSAYQDRPTAKGVPLQSASNEKRPRNSCAKQTEAVAA